MLEHLDTLIAFSVIMLLLSMLITVLVQMASTVLMLRGSNLAWGLKRLLPQVDRELAGHADAIVDRLLRHKAITHNDRTRATAIRKEELVRVLRDLASPDNHDLTGGAKTALARVAAKQEPAGAAGPADKLALEVETWFETVMDRTSERFKRRTRYWTALFAFLLTLLWNIDAWALLERLSRDEDLRARLVGMSANVQELARETLQQPLPAGTQDQRALRDQLTRLQKRAARIEKAIGETQLGLIPLSGISVRRDWGKTNWFGLFMTGVLLSLGAPFWFNALRKLADLRPIVARRVEGEPPKEVRGLNPAAPGAPPAAG